jgi:hypothetical protein
MKQSYGKYHVCADTGSMIESEELAIRNRGAFKSRSESQTWINNNTDLAKAGF